MGLNVGAKPHRQYFTEFQMVDSLERDNVLENLRSNGHDLDPVR
jgi:hypothetical protein